MRFVLRAAVSRNCAGRVRAGKRGVVQSVGHLGVRNDPYAHEQADYGDASQYPPAYKAQVKDKKLPLIAAHNALAFAYAVHRRHLRMIKQQIQRKPVAVRGDYAGDDEQQRPQCDEHGLEDVEPDDAEEHSEAVKQVAEAGRLHADSVEQEYGEARAEDHADDVQQQTDKSHARAWDMVLDKIQG